MPRQYMSSDEPREYMGGAAKAIHDVLTGGAKSRRPQVVKQPTTISRDIRVPPPIIDYAPPRPVYYDAPAPPVRISAPVKEPVIHDINRPIIDYAPPQPVNAPYPQLHTEEYMPYDAPIIDYAPNPPIRYYDISIQEPPRLLGRGAGRRRKHRSPSSSSDEGMEGGWISSLFNVGKAVATAATKVAPKIATTVTRGATTAENIGARAAQVSAAEARAAAVARAASAEAAAAEAAAAAASKPASLGTRLMNTASGLGNFGMLAANIGAPIYMSVDQHENDLKAEEAQRKADREAAAQAAIAAKDRLDALKVQDDLDKASKAQWEAYNLATQILSGTYVTPTSGTSTTTPANTGAAVDILNVITATTNPPPTTSPTAPPPPGSGNPYVPIPPPPPQPPSIAPTQPTSPPTNLPNPTPPPPPPPPYAPVVPPSAAVPPSAPSKPSNQYRGRGRGRRGGVTHASHKANILRILKAHNR